MTNVAIVAFESAVFVARGSCLLAEHLLFYNLLTMAINPFVAGAIYHIQCMVLSHEFSRHGWMDTFITYELVSLSAS